MINKESLRILGEGEVKEQKGRGRYVVARRDLPPGEVILKAKSYALAVCENYKSTVCSSCFKTLPTSSSSSSSPSSLASQHPGSAWRKCPQCEEVAFCFECCSSSVSSFNHEAMECGALRHLHKLNGVNNRRFYLEDISEIRLCIAIIVHRIHQLLYLKKKEKNTSLPEEVGEEEEEYHQVSNLVANRDRLPPDSLRIIREQAECISRCVSSALSSFTSPSPSSSSSLPMKIEEEVTSERDIIDLICKIKCNAFGIWNSKSKCVAMALFPKASMFNHSCLWYLLLLLLLLLLASHYSSSPPASLLVSSNSCRVMEGIVFCSSSSFASASTSSSSTSSSSSSSSQAIISIRTLTQVPKGGELTISYINPRLPLLVRLPKLLNCYFFNCRCVRCNHEKKSKESSPSPSASSPPPPPSSSVPSSFSMDTVTSASPSSRLKVADSSPSSRSSSSSSSSSSFHASRRSSSTPTSSPSLTDDFLLRVCCPHENCLGLLVPQYLPLSEKPSEGEEGEGEVTIVTQCNFCSFRQPMKIPS